MCVILGCDTGTKFGWSVRKENGVFESGVWNLQPTKKEGRGMRTLKLRSFLIGLIRKYQPAVCFYELVRRHKGVEAAHCYGALVGELEATLESFGLPYRGIPVQTIKKFATGNGNAKKHVMINAARQKWLNYSSDDDNEADARWIAECGFMTMAVPSLPETKVMDFML